jgi:transposase
VAVVKPRQARDFAESMGRLAKTDRSDAAGRVRGRARAPRGPGPLHPPLADQEQQALAAMMVTRRRQLVTMLLSERRRLQLAIAVVRPSIEAMIEAIRKPLDDVEAQMVGHVQAHYAELDKLLRSASAIGPAASASLIAGLPELGRLNAARSPPRAAWRRWPMTRATPRGDDACRADATRYAACSTWPP